MVRPDDLAAHLVYLARNETAYMRYLSWRQGAAGIVAEDSPYVRYTRHIRRSIEVNAPILAKDPSTKPYMRRPFMHDMIQRAQVCTLCNRTALAELLAERPLQVTPPMWTGAAAAARWKFNYTGRMRDHHQGMAVEEFDSKNPPSKAELSRRIVGDDRFG